MATQRDMPLLDVRMVERNIQSGAITRKEYQKFLKELPDVADKAVPVEEAQPLKPQEEDQKQ